MVNAMDEMRDLRAAAIQLEWNGEFLKAGIIWQLLVELRNRFNGITL